MLTNRTVSFLPAACLFALITIGLTGCGSDGSASTNNAKATANKATTPDQPTGKAAAPAPDSKPIPAGKIADAATILARPQVPILCYHQIRDWRPRDSKGAKDYIVPVAQFRAQMQMLADSGYHTILPDQLYAYLTTGAPLPPKPVMLTFDDGDEDQYTTALPELNKHGFKGAFFIMTVAIGRHGYQPYMSKEQIKDLSDKGHVIAAHTWDHHSVKKYQGDDWRIQVDEPNRKLQEITGKPMRYFAFPFGLWNKAALPELQKRGYVAAFTLAEGRDEQMPLYTIRRIIAGGYWSANTLHRNMVQSFH